MSFNLTCACAYTNDAMAKIEVDASTHARVTASINLITKVSLFFFGNTPQECSIKFNDELPFRLNVCNIESFTAYINTCDNFAPTQLSICGEKGTVCRACPERVDYCEDFEAAIINLLSETNLQHINFEIEASKHNRTLMNIVNALSTKKSIVKIKINSKANMIHYIVLFGKLKITSLTIKNAGNLSDAGADAYAWSIIYGCLRRKAIIQSLKIYNLECNLAFVGRIFAINSIKRLRLQLQMSLPPQSGQYWQAPVHYHPNLFPMSEVDFFSIMNGISKHPCLENVHIDSKEEIDTTVAFHSVSSEKFRDIFKNNTTVLTITVSPYSEIYSKAFDVINARAHQKFKSARNL